MKILITGGNSSVGVQLKKKLSHHHEVITVGRKDCDIIWDWNKHPNQLEFPDSVDTIIHTAADFGGNDFDSIFDAQKFNTLGTLKVCELAKINNVKHFIHISSIFSTLNIDSPFTSIYALSKKQSEELVEFYLKKSNVDFVILRPSQLFGKEEIFKKHQPFFYQILEKTKNGEEILFFGEKSPLRNYLFIDDLTEIIEKVVDEKVTGIFNCTFPTNISYEEIAEIAAKIYNVNSNITKDCSKNNIEDNIFPYDDTLYKLIDFSPSIDMNEGIKKIAEFYGN